MAPKVSIIVPIYNVELYLKECIDSILSQTFIDFELILIDDGSPDRCPQICDEYAEKDDRIIVIHKENGGVSSARNVGLEIARGEYIGFVDSDDIVAPNMYEQLYKIMIRENVDLVSCGYKKFVVKNNINLNSEVPCSQVILIRDICNITKKFCSVQAPTRDASLWNKLYKREKIKEIFFPPLIFGEDAVYNAYVSQKVDVMAEIETKLYFYRNNPESVCNSKKFETSIDNTIKMKEILKIIVEKEDLRDFYEKQLNMFARKLIADYTKNRLTKYKKEEYSFFYEEYKMIYEELRTIKNPFWLKFAYYFFVNDPGGFTIMFGQFRYYLALIRKKIHNLREKE